MQLDACRLAPASWSRQPIESVCARFTSGGTPSRSRPEFYEEGSIPWIKTKELRDCVLQDSEEHITPEAVSNSSAKVLPTGTILMAMYGATVGQLGILGRPMSCNQACAAMIVDPAVAEPRYLYYQLLAHRAQIKGLSVGAAQQNLSGVAIRQFVLPFPGVNEQRAIADALSVLDERTALLRETNATLESIASAIFKSWFASAINVRIPAAKLIADGVLEIGDGYRAKNSELAEGGVPFVRAGDLAAGRIVPTRDHLGGQGSQRAAGKRAHPGDTAFTSKGTIGRFALVDASDCPAIYSPQVCYWRSGDVSRLHPVYLHFWMKSDAFGSQIESVRGQAAIMDYVSLLEQRRMLIDLPSIEVQNQFADVATPIVKRLATSRSASATLEEIRDILLPRLMSGKLQIAEAQELVKEVVVA